VVTPGGGDERPLLEAENAGERPGGSDDGMQGIPGAPRTQAFSGKSFPFSGGVQIDKKFNFCTKIRSPALRSSTAPPRRV
jgi:hypothetical protein